MDAAHFVLLPFVGILWCFARVFIKAAAGRNRINVLGAMDAVTLRLETVVNTTYVNADTIAEMLEKLAKRFTQLPIYMYWTMPATSTANMSRNWPRPSAYILCSCRPIRRT
jgi:hypothetical protein